MCSDLYVSKTKTVKRTAKEVEQALETSLRLLKTDHVDLWQMHSIENQGDLDKILARGQDCVEMTMPSSYTKRAVFRPCVVIACLA